MDDLMLIGSLQMWAAIFSTVTELAKPCYLEPTIVLSDDVQYRPVQGRQACRRTDAILCHRANHAAGTTWARWLRRIGRSGLATTRVIDCPARILFFWSVR